MRGDDWGPHEKDIEWRKGICYVCGLPFRPGRDGGDMHCNSCWAHNADILRAERLSGVRQLGAVCNRSIRMDRDKPLPMPPPHAPGEEPALAEPEGLVSVTVTFFPGSDEEPAQEAGPALPAGQTILA